MVATALYGRPPPLQPANPIAATPMTAAPKRPLALICRQATALQFRAGKSPPPEPGSSRRRFPSGTTQAIPRAAGSCNAGTNAAAAQGGLVGEPGVPPRQAPRVGLEPTTLRLTAGCSAN